MFLPRRGAGIGDALSLAYGPASMPTTECATLAPTCGGDMDLAGPLALALAPAAEASSAGSGYGMSREKLTRNIRTPYNSCIA